MPYNQIGCFSQHGCVLEYAVERAQHDKVIFFFTGMGNDLIGGISFANNRFHFAACFQIIP
jgi:hypothetical protein